MYSYDDVVKQSIELLTKIPKGLKLARDLEECLRESRAGIARILVVGQDKAGKSTLINVLSRKPIAKTGVVPCNIEGGIACYPWGSDLLCDTMGYLADRKGTEYLQVSSYIGRATIVIYLIHWEGLGPVDLLLLERIRELKVPFIFCVNRMDEIEDQPEIRKDIENQISTQIPWFEPNNIHFLSLKSAVEILEKNRWSSNTELPPTICEFEKRIRDILNREKTDLYKPVIRRTREHMLWLLREVRESDLSSQVSTMRRIQEEVQDKEKWLNSRIGARLSNLMEEFDRIAGALIASIDVGDINGVEAIKKSFEDFFNSLPKKLYDSISSDLDKAKRDLIRAVRDTAEAIEQITHQNEVDPLNVNYEAISQDASEAAILTSNSIMVTEDVIKSLARLSSAMFRLIGGTGMAYGVAEIGEEAGKHLLSVDSAIVQKSVEVAGNAISNWTDGAISAEDVGNAFQASIIIFAACKLVYDLIQYRKSVDAAKKRVEAELYRAKTQLTIELEKRASSYISALIQPFESVLDRIADNIKQEIEKMGTYQTQAEEILSKLPK